MKLYYDHLLKILLAWKPAAYYIVVLCFFLVLMTSSCWKKSQTKPPLGPPPPDLSDCTHVELRYSPSKLEYFIFNRGLFSPEEVNDVESLVPTVIDDPEIIKALAHDVNQGMFLGYSGEGRPGFIHFINIIGYRNGEFVTAFVKTNKHVLTGTKEYSYENDVWPSLEKLKPQALTSKIKPLRLRNECGSNMKRLWSFIIEDPFNSKKTISGSIQMV